MIRGVPVVKVVVVVAIVVGRRYSEWSCSMPRREVRQAVATGIPFRRSIDARAHAFCSMQLSLNSTCVPCPSINHSMLGRIAHYTVDAVLLSTVLAGVKRHTGYT